MTPPRLLTLGEVAARLSNRSFAATDKIKALVEIIADPNMTRWGVGVRLAAELGIRLDWMRPTLTFADGYEMTFVHLEADGFADYAVVIIGRRLAAAAPAT